MTSQVIPRLHTVLLCPYITSLLVTQLYTTLACRFGRHHWWPQSLFSIGVSVYDVITGVPKYVTEHWGVHSAYDVITCVSTSERRGWTLFPCCTLLLVRCGNSCSCEPPGQVSFGSLVSFNQCLEELINIEESLSRFLGGYFCQPFVLAAIQCAFFRDLRIGILLVWSLLKQTPNKFAEIFSIRWFLHPCQRGAFYCENKWASENFRQSITAMSQM